MQTFSEWPLKRTLHLAMVENDKKWKTLPLLQQSSNQAPPMVPITSSRDNTVTADLGYTRMLIASQGAGGGTSSLGAEGWTYYQATAAQAVAVKAPAAAAAAAAAAKEQEIHSEDEPPQEEAMEMQR